MEKIVLISEMNDGFARLVRLANNKRIIIFWDEEYEDSVHFRFYKDTITDDQKYCKLTEDIGGEFIFKDQNVNEDYIQTYCKYKLIYMFAPADYKRMGIGEYILRWFLIEKSQCKFVYTSEPNDLSVRDGSELTGNAINFVMDMRVKGLIHDPESRE